MSNFAFNDKTAIFELQVKQASGLLNSYPNAITLPDGNFLLSVPDYQIKSTIQKLQRLGVKILALYSVNDPKYQEYQEIMINEGMTTTTLETPVTEIKTEEVLKIDPDLPWWVEIFTEYPRCLYYFGPFESEAEALDHQAGYQEDLEQEEAKGIVVTIKQCSPTILTQEL